VSSAKEKVWVCTSGTDYETSGVEAVYADVHGARAWLQKERRRKISAARKVERESAEIEERKPDYSRIPNCPLWTDEPQGTEGFNYSDEWWRITPWPVQR
jgi:hypothetical protein